MLRSAKAAAIVRDRPHAGVGNRHPEIVEGVGRQRPAVHHDDGTTTSPVLHPQVYIVPGLHVIHVELLRCDKCNWSAEPDSENLEVKRMRK